MAAVARRDLSQRIVEVNRLELIQKLKANLDKHIADYAEAKAGYKAVLSAKIEEEFGKAKKQLVKDRKRALERVSGLTDEQIDEQSEHITVVPGSTVRMAVPKSYAKEYQAAIDMATWDVRDSLELTMAEFNCFVRDEWDWKLEFDNVSKMYIGFAK